MAAHGELLIITHRNTVSTPALLEAARSGRPGVLLPTCQGLGYNVDVRKPEQD